MREHLQAGLLCAALAGSTLALAPTAHADSAARDYTLTDCDIQVMVQNQDHPPTTTTAELASWTTEIWVSLPNPMASGEWGEINFDIGTIDTDFLPHDLVSDVAVEYDVTLVDEAGRPAMTLAGRDEPLAVQAASSFEFAPHAYEVQAQSGRRDLRPREVSFAFRGYDEAEFNWAEVRGTCDPLVSAPALMTQYVYDLDAPTDIVTSTASPVQGRELGFTAYNLLEAPLSTPDERIPVMASLGGWPMSSFPLDASGTVTGAFTVPCCLYGDQELRVVNGSRVASVVVHLPQQGGGTPGGPGVSGDHRPSLTLRETFPAKVAAGGRARGSVKVRAPKGFRGTVKIVEGARVLGTAKVVAGRSGTVTLKRLARGRHQLSLVWAGSDAHAGYQPTTRSFGILQR